MKHDVNVHKRFLDYRETHQYFGKNIPMMEYEDFAKLDEEHRLLERKGEDRDDEEEARWVEVTRALFRD